MINLKKEGKHLTRAMLGGANVTPYEWFEDTIFDCTIELNPYDVSYTYDFIGIIESCQDNFVSRVYWNEDETKENAFVTIQPLNNYEGGLAELKERIYTANCDDFSVTIEEGEEWNDCLIIKFWLKDEKD